MKAANSKSNKTAAKKTRKRKVDNSALSICPVNGAGWCPYPFSAAQLKKRQKRLQEEEEAELVTTGKSK
jgi:hypothetical protein